MENKLCDVLGRVHAGDELKQKTAGFLRNEIQQRNKTRVMPRLRLAAACAALLIVFVGGGFAYFTPSAYVDLDVNPSIELVLNRFDRVIEASPYNDDGAAVLRDVDIHHKTYDTAVQILIDKVIERGYLDGGGDGLVTLTVQTGDNGAEQKLLGGLQVKVSESLAHHSNTVSTELFAVTQEVRHHAHGYNLSPAKYIAITELQEVDADATIEECSEHSISKIRQLTEETHEEHHNDGHSEHHSGGEH